MGFEARVAGSSSCGRKGASTDIFQSESGDADLLFRETSEREGDDFGVQSARIDPGGHSGTARSTYSPAPGHEGKQVPFPRLCWVNLGVEIGKRVISASTTE